MKVGKRQPFLKKSEVWPFLHIPGDCWYGTYTDHQAKGIIEGTYTDYITDDLFSTDFKYMFEAKIVLSYQYFYSILSYTASYNL